MSGKRNSTHFFRGSRSINNKTQRRVRLGWSARAEIRSKLILPQGRHRYGYVQRRGACAHSCLTSVRGEGADGSVALAAAAPEHVAKHSGCCARTTGGKSFHKVGRNFLIGGWVVVAVGDD